MKTTLPALLFLLLLHGEAEAAQNPPKISGRIYANQALKQDFSGRSLAEQREFVRAQRLDGDDLDRADVAIRLTRQLEQGEIDQLEAQGIDLNPYTWVPPVPGHHPHGVIMAQVPYELLPLLEADPRVVRVACAERRGRPRNWESHEMTGVDEVHAGGTLFPARTGKGVKVAIADSGLALTDDLLMEHADLPQAAEMYDVTEGETVAEWSSDVDNSFLESGASGWYAQNQHGMNVTGIVFGQGFGPAKKYLGAAPDAELYFYKIAKDKDEGDAAPEDMIKALNRAVEVGVDVFSMSYGYRDDFNDGSSAIEQAVDNAVANGVTVFIAAGNLGTYDIHDSAKVAPGASWSTQLTIGSTGQKTIRVAWRDNLVFDENVELECTNLNGNATFSFVSSDISPRGTEVRMYRIKAHYDNNHPQGDLPGTYTLKVRNTASGGPTPRVHLYTADTTATFNSPDPYYMVDSPGTADSAITVGAWVQKTSWVNYKGDSYSSSQSYDTAASFSSRGPRIDGLLKPDIMAPGSMTISTADEWYANNVSIEASGYEKHLISVNPSYYYAMQGTSQATPYAAGAAALMLEENPLLTPALIRKALTESTFTAANPNNHTGYGLIKVANAFAGELVQSLWVDLDYDVPVEVGTYPFPYNTLAEAAAVATPFRIIRIKASSSPETLVIDQPMTITGYNGVATVGQ